MPLHPSERRNSDEGLGVYSQVLFGTVDRFEKIEAVFVLDFSSTVTRGDHEREKN
jgi:hypothetical protein